MIDSTREGRPFCTAAALLLAGCLLAGARAQAADQPLSKRLFLRSADAPALLSAGPRPPEARRGFCMMPMCKSEEGHDSWDLAQALLLPGVDQAQHGQWLKAALFVTAEAGVFIVSRSLKARGNELDADFKAFANAHWDYDRYVAYRQHPGEFALEEGWLDRNIDEETLRAEGISQAELEALFADTADDTFDASAGEGSHILPGNYLDGFVEGQNGAWDHFYLIKTQQFYEMIGKYAEFQRGWDGYGLDNGWEFGAQQPWNFQEFCAQSTSYMSMRTASNDKLIAADRLLGLLIVNHVASFLDVLLQLRHEHHPDGAQLDIRGVPLETGRGRRAGLELSWTF